MDQSNKKTQARADYEAGAKYRDIAAKYGVSINTLKSWRQRHGWKRGAPTSKRGAPIDAKRVHSKKAVQLVKSAQLPDKQKMFAMYYLQRFNATWAYMQAYGSKNSVARTEGARLLAKPSVRQLIDGLKEEHATQLDITAMDILQEYAKQASSDLGDYLDFGSEEVQDTDEEGKPRTDASGEPVMVTKDHIHLRNKDEVDTSLLKTLKWNQGGIVVELYDKQKAMDALLNRLPDTDGQLDDDEDDGLIDALRDAAAGVWDDDDKKDDDGDAQT